MSMRSLVFQMLVNQLDSWTQLDKATLKKLQEVLFEEYSVLIPGDSSDLPGNLPGYHASFQSCFLKSRRISAMLIEVQVEV